jgi:hypothetical protein
MTFAQAAFLGMTPLSGSSKGSADSTVIESATGTDDKVPGLRTASYKRERQMSFLRFRSFQAFPWETFRQAPRPNREASLVEFQKLYLDGGTKKSDPWMKAKVLLAALKLLADKPK